MRTRRKTVLLFGAAAVVGIGWFLVRPQPSIDFAVSPQTVYTTIEFEVGATYTFGTFHVPDEVKRPVTVTAIEFVATRGIEVIGTGVLDSPTDVIGLVPGWPPPGYPISDSVAARRAWSGRVEVVVGVRVTEQKSGLRGIDVRWLDAEGRAGGSLRDWAVVTCSPGACTADEPGSEALLRELGLLR